MKSCMTSNIRHTTCSTSEKIEKKSLHPRAVSLQNKQPHPHPPHLCTPRPLQNGAVEVNSSFAHVVKEALAVTVINAVLLWEFWNGSSFTSFFHFSNKLAARCWNNTCLPKKRQSINVFLFCPFPIICELPTNLCSPTLANAEKKLKTCMYVCACVCAHLKKHTDCP